jgi:hypothetical protein
VRHLFKVGGGPDESDPIIIFYHSVRVTSMKAFDHGLVIADFNHMPFGCSVWPAFWTVGPNCQWPGCGEIDVVEGVNNKQMLVNSYFFSFRRRFMSGFRNQYTFHTGADQVCNIPNQATIVNGVPTFTGTVMNTNCSSSPLDDTGCAFLDTSNSSFGQGFANASGGIFALLRNSDGFRIWHFERQSVPPDVYSGNPNPDSWPTPMAFLSAANCAVGSFFSPQTLILDTTLCGGWANGDYPNSGCPGTCTQQVTTGSNYVSAYLMNFLPVMLYRYEFRCYMAYQFHNYI